MMPFLYPTQPPAPFPILVIANQTYVEDDDDDDDDDGDDEDDYLASPTTIFPRNMPMPMTPFSQFVNGDGQLPPPPPPPMFNHNDDPRTFRLRMNVDGFLPNELNVSIRHGRLIVRGKHVVRAQSQSSQPITTNSIVDGNDDTEPDFIAKEFKRTFTIPPNTDPRKAHAQFYPQQQVLVVEIPFQNPIVSSEIRIIRARIRPMDIFLTIVTILLMDRALRITYEQFMINEQQPTNTSSHSTHRRRDNRNIFF